MSADRVRGRRSAPVQGVLTLLFALALGIAGLPSSAALEEPGDVLRTAARPVSYDDTVTKDRPAAYWAMRSPGAGTEKDLAGKLHGSYHGKAQRTTPPNGDAAADFDGTSQYLQVPDAAASSAATRGVLTIEAWMRPDSLDYRSQEGPGYVHWMRKGEWIHYVLGINAKDKVGSYPNGCTKICRNGQRMDQDDLKHDGTVVVPRRGSASFRVGTRDLRSFFDGAVGKVVVCTEELLAERIEEHYRVMTRR